jgi:hypothetical protein
MTGEGQGNPPGEDDEDFLEFVDEAEFARRVRARIEAEPKRTREEVEAELARCRPDPRAANLVVALERLLDLMPEKDASTVREAHEQWRRATFGPVDAALDAARLLLKEEPEP